VGWRRTADYRSGFWAARVERENPPLNWHFFANTFAGIDAPVQAFVVGVVSALTGYLTPIMRVLIVVYIAANALITATNPSQEPLTNFLRQLTGVALVFFIISSAANFNQYFGTMFLTTLPTEITNAISGATGGNTLSGDAFDNIWNRAWTAGLVVYKNLPWSLKGIALQFLVVSFWIIAIMAIGIGFMVYLGCHVTLALVVALGPLFVCCFLFPASRRFFDGWISTMVSLVLTQVLTITLLVLLTNTENITIAQIAANSSGNEIAQIQLLLYAIVLFVMCALLASQLPGIAVGIAGGVHQQVSVYSQAIYSAGEIGRSSVATARSAVVGTARAIGNVGTSRSRVFGPAGRSISGSS
jgi:type IV secretion system protein VirB6